MVLKECLQASLAWETSIGFYLVDCVHFLMYLILECIWCHGFVL